MLRQTGCVQTDARGDASVYAMVVVVFLSHWRSAVIVPDSISEVYYCWSKSWSYSEPNKMVPGPTHGIIGTSG
jgi:hypothetical protein